MNHMKAIRQLSEIFHADAVAIRRHLHAHPELSFKEFQTAAFIAQQLSDWGISFRTGVAGTGIVAHIEGMHPKSRTIALRADMDALPIQEAHQKPYASLNPGVMHACGHDVHTTCLLIALRILFQLRHQWTGSVRALFQPGEEMAPGGASLMIAEGVLENPTPAAIFGQHVHPPLPAGMVGFKEGMYMASTDEIYLEVAGKGGHAALPHQTVDPVSISAQLITTLQHIISRQTDPIIPSVLSFGSIFSEGGACNVIPNKVYIAGTFRTHNETWRKEACQRIQQLSQAVCHGLGATCTVRVVRGYPALFNHEALTRHARAVAQQYLGNENVVELPQRMTGEDFAFYAQVIPASFFRLGTGNIDKGITSPVHSDTFDIDEDALVTGSGLMACLAMQQLPPDLAVSAAP
jgi:amidohydrolase